MADTPISALTAVVTPALTDEFVVNQGGVSKKITRQQIIDQERYMLRADASRTLTSTTASQAIFASGASALTLPVGVYRFEAMLYLTAMSATSGNALLSMIGAGTATVGTWLWHAVGVDAATPTSPVAQGGSWVITGATGASAMVNGTGTAMGARSEGTFEVTGAGTIIPSVSLTTAAAAVVAAGCYFWAERVSSSTSLTSLGPAS